MASGHITSWQIEGEKVKALPNCIFLGSKITADGDNVQLCCTPFPIWNQSVVPCLVLTVAS